MRRCDRRCYKGGGSSGGSGKGKGGGGESVNTNAPIGDFQPTSDISQLSKLDGWEQFALNNYDLVLDDNIDVFRSIQREATAENFRAVVDKNGNLQAAAIFTRQSDAILINDLATAPWNLTGGDRRTTKGAGSAMIVSAVRESIARGGNGRVRLDAFDGSEGFYRRLGFTGQGTKLELSPTAARELLNRYQ